MALPYGARLLRSRPRPPIQWPRAVRSISALISSPKVTRAAQNFPRPHHLKRRLSSFDGNISGRERAMPLGFPEDIWNDLDTRGLSYLRLKPHCWPARVREQISAHNLSLSGDHIQDSIPRLPKDYWFEVDEQDPHSRINYLSPAWLVDQRLYTDDSRLSAVKQILPGASRIEPHYLPFWLTTVVIPVEERLSGPNARQWSESKRKPYRQMEFLVSAVQQQHWASGIILPCLSRTYMTRWELEGKYGEISRQPRWAPATFALAIRRWEETMRNSLSNKWEPFLDLEDWSPDTVPFFECPAPRATSTRTLQKLATHCRLVTSFQSEGVLENYYLAEGLPSAFFAMPVYLPCYKVHLSSGGIGFIDAGHTVDDHPRGFRLERRPRHASRRFKIAPVPRNYEDRRISLMPGAARWMDSSLYFAMNFGKPPDPADVSNNRIHYDYLVPEMAVPLSEQLISLMRDRGEIRPEHWNDPSILACMLKKETESSEDLSYLGDVVDQYCASLFTAEKNVFTATKPDWFHLSGQIRPSAPLAFHNGKGRPSGASSGDHTHPNRASARAGGASRPSSPPPPPRRTAAKASNQSSMPPRPSGTNPPPPPPPAPRRTTANASHQYSIPPRPSGTIPPPRPSPSFQNTRSGPTTSVSLPGSAVTQGPPMRIPHDDWQYYKTLRYFPINADLLDPKFEVRVDRDLQRLRLILTHRHHTDRKGGSLQKMQEVNVAYDRVKTLELREKYYRREAGVGG